MSALHQSIFDFDGSTFVPKLDAARLGKQLVSVYGLMSDERWRTLREIGDELGQPEQSVSARLRDLRKPKFGAYTVERRRRGEAHRGIFEYRLLKP